VPHSRGILTVNPSTGDRFRHGEIRKDGFIFDHYDMGMILQNGFIFEHWRSPENFNKKYKYFPEKVSAWLDKKKLRKGCNHCGYKKHAIALVWHHVDPSTKKGEISSMKKNTLSRFKKIVLEIWKCVVLCANCHNVEHQRLRILNDKN
tara:strand:- start:34 stop:477 length:444 start_codon:yes stop_codon:yes gene_type:complete